MTPMELQQAALAQAQALYKPQRDEYRYEQTQLAAQQQAAAAGMQALITALQKNVSDTGTSGPYADIFRQQLANAGIAQVQEANNKFAAGAEDIRHNIAQLESQITGKAYDIYGSYQNAIGDYQNAKLKQANADRAYGLQAQRVAL